MNQLRIIFTTALLFILCGLPTLASAAAGITFNNDSADFSAAVYQETATDLRVKVLGGQVRHRRYLKGGIWQFNPSWANLQFVIYEGSSSLLPDEIKRNRFAYKKVGSETWVYDERKYIVKTPSGYQWKNRKGDWINYNEEGVMLAYGDRNNIQVSFTRDTDGRVWQVKDHNNDVVLTYTYNTDGWLDHVEDYTGRKVEYTYEVTTGDTGTSDRGIVKGGRIDTVIDVLGETWTYNYTDGLVTERLAPGGQSKTIVYSAMLNSAGAYTSAYVCVDWAGGEWTLNEASGNWGFGGERCLSKVKQADSKQAFAATPSTPEDRVPYKVKSIAVDGVQVSRFTFLYNDRKKQWTHAVQDGDGGLKVRTYNEDGEIIGTVKNGRQMQSMTIAGNDHTTADENGNKTITRYDSYDNPILTIHPDGSRVSRTYDPTYSNLLEEIDENGIITKHEYDASGNRTKTIAAVGLPEEIITEYEYDNLGRLELIRYIDSINPENTVTESLDYTGDTKGNVTSRTDGEGHETQYKDFDALGNPWTVIDGRIKTTLFTYDGAGNLKSVKTPLGHLTTYEYDQRGNRTKMIAPGARETGYGYDLRGRMESTTNPNGDRTAYLYNHRDQQIRITDAEGRITYMVYDTDGNLIQTTDGNGNTITYDYGYLSIKPYKGLLNRINYPTYNTTYSYDNRDRKILEIDKDHTAGAAERSTAYAYDKVGNLTQITDAEGRVTVHSYDGHNRLISTRDAAQEITKYQYDARGNLKTVTNARDILIREYEYDGNNRVNAEILPDTTRLEITYDANGNVKTRTDAKGQVSKYDYDDDNRLTFVRYFNNTTDAQNNTNAQKTVSFGYDAYNNLTSWSDGSLSGTYDYDDAHRLTDITVNYGTFTKAASYSYYKNGNKKTWTGPDGLTISYGYDSNNQLQTVTIPGQGTITVNQYQWAVPTQITLPGGIERTHDYDGYLRQTLLKTTDTSDNALLEHQYTHSPANNITQQNILTGSETGPRDYQYDLLDRLTQIDHTQNATTNNTQYDYDPVGNRISDNKQPGVWQYDNRDRLELQDQRSYAYDANGSLEEISHTTDGIEKTFEFNLENRLTTVRDGSGNTIASYLYDPFGRRIAKTVSGITNYFFYGQEGLAAEMDASGNVTTSYGWQPDGTWGTDPLYIKQGTQFGYYQNDHLGTPQRVVTAGGSLLWSASYDAFGEATITQETLINNLRFPGQYNDSKTGLYYNYFRYYEPQLGRYLTSDPIKLGGGINTYVYSLNNTLRYYDPLGERSITRPVFGPGPGTPGSSGTTDGGTPYDQPSPSIPGGRNIPRDIGRPNGRGRYECVILCDVFDIRGEGQGKGRDCKGSKCPAQGWGYGLGKNEKIAWNNAWHAVDNNIPNKCQKRHCRGKAGSCKGWKGGLRK